MARKMMNIVSETFNTNRSLSASEVAALYANATSKYLPLNFTNLQDGAYPYTVYSQDRAGNVYLYEPQRPVLGIPLYSGWNLISLIMNSSVSSSSGNRTIEVRGALSAGDWNLIGYSSDNEVSIDDVIFTNSTGSNFTFNDAWLEGYIAPYFAYFDPTAGADGAFRYIAPNAFGNSYRHTMLNRTGYWVKAYADGNLTFPNSGGAFENATYAWANVRVDNGVREMSLWDAETNTLMESSVYYHNPVRNTYETVDNTGDDYSRNYFNSWEGLFTNVVSGNNLTLIRRN